MASRRFSWVWTIPVMVSILGGTSIVLPLLELAVVAQTVQTRRDESIRLNEEGLGLNQQGKSITALEKYQQALTIVREIKDKQGESTILNNIGGVYNDLGQYDEALEYFQQALAISKEAQDPLGEGRTLNNIGGVYSSLGQYNKALKYYEQSLVIRKEVKDRLGEGRTLNNIGGVYSSLGQYDKALEHFQQALVISKEAQDPLGEGRILNNIGLMYRRLEQYDKALEYYQQTLAISKEVKDPLGEGAALNNIGLVYDRLEQYDKALEYYQQTLAISKEMKDRPTEGKALSNIGVVYGSLRQYDKALEYFQQALAISKEVKDRTTEGTALNNIGAVLLANSKSKEAEQQLLEAIKIWESLRAGLVDQNKVSLFETQRMTYGYLQSALVEQDRYDNALEIAERGRTRALVELLSTRLQASEKTLLADSNETASIKATSLTEIQQIAKQQNLTLIEYSFAEALFEKNGRKELQEVLFTWVIQPNGQVTFRKNDLTSLQRPLKELVSIGRDAIGVRSRGDRTIVPVPVSNPEQQKKALQQLHKILIKPIADLLPKDPNQRVAFMPQDSLFLVPFAALQDKDGKYLIEKHTIVTAPSIQTLQFTRETKLKQKSQTDEALIVGNPIMPKFNETQLSDLPGAKQEAIAISKLFSTQPLIGAQATEAEVSKLMKTAKYIHLATHGLLDSIKGDIPGAIALTPDTNNNGFLTAGEIFEMQLNADLVVLSACDTARGDIKGEGVIGLSRSLISAGVPSIIVSLWQVPDAPTASLMTEFYRNLREKKLDKAQSLRQAMLTTMKQHPNPRDWAAFTLIGESE